MFHLSLSGASSDGIGQLRWVSTPVAGLRFSPWLANLGLDETRDVITHIEGVAIERLAERLTEGPWSPFPLAGLVNFYLVRDGNTPLSVTVANHDAYAALLSFDVPQRWSIPLMIMTFWLIGSWIYIKRPHEQGAIALFRLGCSILVYQTFQPTLRTAIILTQPALFWFDQCVSTVSGFFIFGSLMHLALSLPSVPQLTADGLRRFTWALYLVPLLIFGVLQALRYALREGSFAYMIHLQQDWQWAQSFLFVACIGLAVRRYVTLTDPRDRSTMKALLFATMPLIILILASEKTFLLMGLSPLIDDNLRRAISVMFPLLAGVTILRHRVFNVEAIADRAIRFSFFFATCIVVILVLGALSVYYAKLRPPSLITLLSLGLCWVISQPLILYVNRFVERLFYGDRGQVQRVMAIMESEFDPTTSPDKVLAAWAHTLRVRLRLGFVSILLNTPIPRDADQATLITSSGVPSTRDQMSFPIMFQKSELGHLRIQVDGDERFDPHMDIHALRPVLQQLAHLAYALRATLELRHSQDQVRQQEAERQRIEHHLHDALGANLAGVTFLLEAELRRAELTHTAPSLSTLREVTADLKRSVHEVREIANRNVPTIPAELQNFGLSGALHRYVSRRMPNLHLIMLINDPPHLPDAIRTTLYLVAQEALQNIARHAHATQVDLSLTEVQNDNAASLLLTIADNGKGIADNFKPGTGLSSMHHRAAAIHGQLIIEPNQPCGMKISMRIPWNNTTLP